MHPSTLCKIRRSAFVTTGEGLIQPLACILAKTARLRTSNLDSIIVSNYVTALSLTTIHECSLVSMPAKSQKDNINSGRSVAVIGEIYFLKSHPLSLRPGYLHGCTPGIQSYRETEISERNDGEKKRGNQISFQAIDLMRGTLPNQRDKSRFLGISQYIPGSLVFLSTYDIRIWLGFRHGGHPWGHSEFLSCHLCQSAPETVK